MLRVDETGFPNASFRDLYGCTMLLRVLFGWAALGAALAAASLLQGAPTGFYGSQGTEPTETSPDELESLARVPAARAHAVNSPTRAEVPGVFVNVDKKPSDGSATETADEVEMEEPADTSKARGRSASPWDRYVVKGKVSFLEAVGALFLVSIVHNAVRDQFRALEETEERRPRSATPALKGLVVATTLWMALRNRLPKLYILQRRDAANAKKKAQENAKRDSVSAV